MGKPKFLISIPDKAAPPIYKCILSGAMQLPPDQDGSLFHVGEVATQG